MSSPPAHKEKPTVTDSKKPSVDASGLPSKNDDTKKVTHRGLLWWLLRLLILLSLILVLLCLLVWYMLGTDEGTEFIIDKLIDKTGVSLEYGEGNFRDGLSVTNVKWTNETVSVALDKGFVKIGWRAVLNEKLHLRALDINNLHIHYLLPSEGKPFDYPEVRLPYNLYLDNTKAASVTYQQTGEPAFKFTNVVADSLVWKGTKLYVSDADINCVDIADVKNLNGDIDFKDEYPLDADAQVMVKGWDAFYWDSIDVQAGGTLKNIKGKLETKYNKKYKVKGVVNVQPLEKDIPFEGVLNWHKAKLPYATQHDIWLKNSRMQLKGDANHLDIDINSKVDAKGIPIGQYQGTARLDFQKNKLDIAKLTVKNKKGQLTGEGILDWKKTFFMDVSVQSAGYDLTNIIPEQYGDYQDYQGYLPNKLQGSVSLKYQQKNAQGKVQIDSTLKQQNAETVTVMITPLQALAQSSKKSTHSSKVNKKSKPSKVTPTVPWEVTANWKNYYRKIDKKLDKHHIGLIDSEYGNANLLITDKTIEATINAKVKTVKVAPEGEYQLKLTAIDEVINIDNLAYQGRVGVFNGNGQVVLSKNNAPLVWQVNGTAKDVKPFDYHKSIPITLINGKLKAKGSVAFEKRKSFLRKTKNIHHHDIELNQTDLTLSLSKQYDSREIAIKGEGKVGFHIDNDSLVLQDNFESAFKGQIKTADIPEGNYDFVSKATPDKAGNLYDFHFTRLNYSGQQGKLNARGKLNLKDATQWDIKANLSRFDLGFFQPNNPAILTGELISQGRYIAEVLAVPKTSAIKAAKSTISTTSTQSKDISHAQNNTKIAKKTTKKIKQPAKLEDFAVKFSGTAETKKLPAGNMLVDISGKDTNEVIIHQLQHKGETGFIDVAGKVNLTNGYDWQVKGKMDNFNLGYFRADLPTSVTGKVNTKGQWRSQDELLQNFDVKFDGSVKTDKLPAGKLTVDVVSAKNDTNDIIINKLIHQGDAGMIEAKGRLNLNHGYQWQLDSSMKNFNLGYFVKDMPSHISGQLVSNGYWTDSLQRIDIKKMDITGDLKGQKVEAKGQLNAKLRLPKDIPAFIKKIQQSNANDAYHRTHQIIETLTVNNLLAKWQGNYISANGDAKNLQTKVSVTNLDQLSDKLKGKIIGGVQMQQTDTAKLPTIYVDLQAKQLDLAGVIISGGHIQGKVVELGNKISRLSLSAKKLTAGSHTFHHLDTLFEGTESQHQLNLTAKNEDITVSGKLTGGLVRQGNKWQGVLENGRVMTNGIRLRQLKPAKMVADVNQTKLQLTSHCWQVQSVNKPASVLSDTPSIASQQGRLCLQNSLVVSEQSGLIDIALQQMDTSLLGTIIPKDIDWQAKINGQAKIRWQQKQAPVVNASLYTNNGKIGVKQDDNSHVYLPYQRVSMTALTTSKGLKLRTDINAKGDSKGYSEIIIDPNKASKPIEGDLVLNNLNLAMFKPFFPGMRTLQGNGSLISEVKGTLQKPRIYGDMQFTEGRMSMVGLPISLSNVNAVAQIRGTQANIKGQFNSGSGVGKLSGVIDWQGDMQTKLGITGENLEVAQPPLISAKMNPDINIIIKPNQKYVEIKGVVSIPSATLRPPEANEDTIIKSSDVEILDRRTVDNIDEVLAITEPWSINADIGLDLGSDVTFRGFGAELPMAGALIMTQRGQGDLQGKGVIQVSRSSSVDVFGQSLDLKYAQLRFDGNLQQPNISIDTAKVIDGSTVGVRVKGDASKPKITVYNDTGLSQQQAMNALVTGRFASEPTNQVSEEGFRSEITNNLAAAGLSVGLNTTRNLTNKVGRAVGLQSLVLSANASGSTNDTNINVTGHITSDLYIRYGFGVFNAQSELSARYQLSQRLYLEATSSTEKFIDLVYGWEF